MASCTSCNATSAFGLLESSFRNLDFFFFFLDLLEDSAVDVPSSTSLLSSLSSWTAVARDSSFDFGGSTSLDSVILRMTGSAFGLWRGVESVEMLIPQDFNCNHWA